MILEELLTLLTYIQVFYLPQWDKIMQLSKEDEYVIDSGIPNNTSEQIIIK